MGKFEKFLSHLKQKERTLQSDGPDSNDDVLSDEETVANIADPNAVTEDDIIGKIDEEKAKTEDKYFG